MIHSGQEFARSKVIATNNYIADNEKGQLDHNSYNKDNFTNYINYNQAEMNLDLLDYYKGLIELRKTYEEFRRAESEQIKFFNLGGEFSIGFSVKMYDKEFIVLMNSSKQNEEQFLLPDGEWEIFVNNEKAGIDVLSTVSGQIKIPTTSGLILKRK